jgi:hypothetical protein
MRQRSAWLRSRRAFELVRHHGDGAQRRAQLVGRGRGQRAQRRQALFARQSKLGGGKTGRHPRAFAGDAPGIDRGKSDAEHERSPQAGLIKLRQHEMLGQRPGQRFVHHRDQRSRRQRDATQDQRIAQIEGRRRDDDGSDEHQGERIGDAAGEIEKGRQLQHVVSEINGRLAVGEPVAGRMAQGQDDVETGAEGYASQALNERQGIAEAEIDDEQSRRLAARRHPAQIRQGAKAHAPSDRRSPRGLYHPRPLRLFLRIRRRHGLTGCLFASRARNTINQFYRT